MSVVREVFVSEYDGVSIKSMILIFVYISDLFPILDLKKNLLW